MHKLNIDHPAQLFAQLRAITNACDPNEYAPLEYDIDGIYLRLTDGSSPTSDYLFAVHVVANRADIAIHYEGEGANYRRYRLVYLAPIETYFWGEYQWRDCEGFTVRVTPAILAQEVGFERGEVDESERSAHRPAALCMLHNVVRSEFDGFNGEQPVACGGRSAG